MLKRFQLTSFFSIVTTSVSDDGLLVVEKNKGVLYGLLYVVATLDRAPL